MILLFININKRKLLYLILVNIFFSGNLLAAINKFYLNDKSGFIFWKCKNNQCNIFLKKEHSEEIILKNTPPPSIHAINNLITFFLVADIPCNYTFFYNSNKGISKSFEFVIAVNIENEIVVVAENNLIVGYKIFNSKKPVFCIKRDWSPTSSLFSAIIKAKFIGKNLYLKYLKGKNYSETIEVIHNLKKCIKPLSANR